MKKYRVTLERRVRTVRWFEAENDDAAALQAEMIHRAMNPSDYEDSESEDDNDFAVIDENGRDIVHWG